MLSVTLESGQVGTRDLCQQAGLSLRFDFTLYPRSSSQLPSYSPNVYSIGLPIFSASAFIVSSDRACLVSPLTSPPVLRTVEPAHSPTERSASSTIRFVEPRRTTVHALRAATAENWMSKEKMVQSNQGWDCVKRCVPCLR